MPITGYLNPDNSFDTAAIMRRAVAKARNERAAHVRQGLSCTWAEAMAYGLRHAWDDARTQRGMITHREALAAEQARLAIASEAEREIAAVERAVVFAEYGDAFTTMQTRELAGLTRRLDDLRRAA